MAEWSLSDVLGLGGLILRTGLPKPGLLYRGLPLFPRVIGCSRARDGRDQAASLEQMHDLAKQSTADVSDGTSVPGPEHDVARKTGKRLSKRMGED